MKHFVVFLIVAVATAVAAEGPVKRLSPSYIEESALDPVSVHEFIPEVPRDKRGIYYGYYSPYYYGGYRRSYYPGYGYPYGYGYGYPYGYYRRSYPQYYGYGK